MYVIFLQCTHCVKKTLPVLCTLLCESGDRVKVDQSPFSADLHAVDHLNYCHHHQPLSLLPHLLANSEISIWSSFSCVHVESIFCFLPSGPQQKGLSEVLLSAVSA